ncbi:Mannose-1-phosphate guanylyltransferase [Syntrophobotulus glycolicus DSM 8271]|uniref:mannose-1-phosphate guanylyltransferase n=1 Tax=Syntrophobotulus glycolicus (strain DSM 8271 / FlGlyR) TaxID=645991 RepID=F0T1V0_SYNGF|nr:mannose-1-phosphate guanylyltransferase [Syntrophobotulus glycolicus]ADY55214.1 Mannose-1-phosphate guanylyltransferase [Syntrophobotulus glycolicus DSM 8271]
MPFAVIMAGGRGERFWPRSRVAVPKQFLNLVGDKTMLQLTVERVREVVGISDTYIVAGRDFKEMILEQVPHLPEENILIEPFGRDTAAAIGLAALVLERKDPREVMIVLPADHYIRDVPRFQEVLKSAVAAARRGEDIVTLGITPHRPETGYGYIFQGELADTFHGVGAYRVARFLEKPDYAKAVVFLSTGNYLWNSGMFIWRVDLIRQLIEQHTPGLAQGLRLIGQAMGTKQYLPVLEEIYAGLPKISVDYGVLEKAERVLVMRGDFGWDDIGSWAALERYAEKDEQGNVIEGRGVLLDTRNTFIYSPGKTVGVIGVENLIVVNDRDCLMVCGKNRAQELKKVVQALKDEGLEEAL